MDLQILKIGDKCTGCGACVSVCPKNALSLLPNNEGFYFPELDVQACIDCHLCDKSCQVLDPATIIANHKRRYFMAKASDEAIVKASSSGGVFSLLANKIINEEGVVYGARYDFENERLIQDSTEHCELADLRKSKYIESYTGSIFKSVGENLIQGLKVLYVGTPCQIEGLSKYLNVKRINRENLILVQFVCHGVPSNAFFTEYKHFEEKKHKSKLISFDFRPKVRGWRFSEWKMNFANGDTEQGPYYYYYYYYYFQNNKPLRTSCYSCKRVLNETPDITIGDFWGIQKFKPEVKDNEGISVVMVHNSKGANIIESLEGFKYIEEIPEHAIEYIKRETQTRSDELEARVAFMSKVHKKGYMRTVKNEAGHTIFIAKLKDKIRNFLKR